MSDPQSDNRGEATPSDVAEEAVSDDQDVEMGMGEDSGAVSDPGDSLEGEEMDGVMT